MDTPALTHELEILWQQIEALQRGVTAAVGEPQAALRNALAQLATALRTLRTTQEAQHQAHEVAEVQGEAQRRDLADVNTRLRAEITTSQQALIRAGRVLTAAFAARQRAEQVQASLTNQLQVNADQLAITEGQLEARTAELLLANQEIEAMHAELLAMNAELLAFNTALLAQVARETEAGTT
jgi:chromosome segregation ATPase